MSDRPIDPAGNDLDPRASTERDLAGDLVAAYRELQSLLLATPDVDHFFAQVATTLLLVLQRADQIALEEQLRSALATREVVDQAIGILMGQQGIDATAAFAVLPQASRARNRKLADIAAELIETVTGSPPRPPRPFTDPR